jgi:hypothetical protein
MQKLLTEEEVRAYLSENNSVTNVITDEFINGALWLLEMNSGYINLLLDTIRKKQLLVDRYSEKINEYEEMYMGSEPVRTRKARKKSSPSDEEKEAQLDILSDMFADDGGFDEYDDDEYYD